MNTYCPFVEKHRPSRFEDIVLEKHNKQILTNVINDSYFPNMLFYGPPGTGKTTTIMNVINAYHEKLNVKGSGMTIHLNASDERGIDTIRNQIINFVSSNPLFNTGMKFIILDEVDYMTKNAQQALRYLLQSYPSNVRFCLICNYISKIDDGLQNEFLKLRFNQLPQQDIIRFLERISTSEGLHMNNDTLSAIQKLYKSDMWSMVNFMQTNQDRAHDTHFVINNAVWDDLYRDIKANSPVRDLVDTTSAMTILYNVNVKNIVVEFLNYIIRSHKGAINVEFLNFVESIIHINDMCVDKYIDYAFFMLRRFLSEDKCVGA